MKSFGVAVLISATWIAVSTRDGGYSAAVGEVEFISQNDYMLWFLQGEDTAGQPVSTHVKETHSYSDVGDLLEVSVRLEGIDMPFEKSETITIRRSGQVVAVDGVAVGDAEDARVDFLPRIPDSGPLSIGTSWIDTVSSGGSKPYGPTSYRAERHYEVVGTEEIDGSTTVLIVGEGTLALRQGGWQNEDQGVFWWQDVAGPVVDSVWFATERGQLVRDITFMDLVGTGGFGNGAQEVRMDSGLRSRVDRRVQSSAK